MAYTVALFVSEVVKNPEVLFSHDSSLVLDLVSRITQYQVFSGQLKI